jgi:programmed cell death protein 5
MMDEIRPEDIERMRQLEELKKTVRSRVMTKGAIERLGRLRMVKPELADQIELFIVQLYQQGQIKSMIDDSQLKEILEGITTKKDFNIRKR